MTPVEQALVDIEANERGAKTVAKMETDGSVGQQRALGRASAYGWAARRLRRAMGDAADARSS